MYDFFFDDGTLSLTAVRWAHKLNKAHIKSCYDTFSAHSHLMIVVGQLKINSGDFLCLLLAIVIHDYVYASTWDTNWSLIRLVLPAWEHRKKLRHGSSKQI